ncbi:MAG: radical SAM protein, partial [bacterium]|nr:radical SAM protein [bacterium]
HWRRGGFYRARIGVESGSQKVLDLMEKNITVDQIKSTVSSLAYAGIKTTAYIVVGHPGETEEDFQQTLTLMEELKDDIWEAECNPFTYFFSGQLKSAEWAAKRALLYPQWAKEMLITQTWYVNSEPTREAMYDRVARFVSHCRKLGISLPWSLKDVDNSDQRWKRLHKNAVPPLLELINKERYIDECKTVAQLHFARDTPGDDMDFDF